MNASHIERYENDNYPIIAILNKNGVPVNLTGATVSFTIKKTTGDEVIVGTIIDALSGEVKFEVTSGNMSPVGTYSYKIKVVDSASYVTTYASAKLILI